MFYFAFDFVIAIDIQCQGTGCLIAWSIWVVMFVLLFIDRHKREH